MRKSIAFIGAAFLVWVGSSSAARASAPHAELRLETPGRTHSLTLSELKGKLPVATMTVDDPVYKTKKTYEGFWLRDVLALGGIGKDGGDELVFKCLDGYSPTLAWAKLEGRQGLLAIREKGLKGDWKSFKQGKTTMTPAPFYLVWDTKDEAYPWPYQLVGIEAVKFKAKYALIFPEGQASDSSVYRGFDLFRTQCMRCHSINLQGGELGPELNIPRNIMEYRDEATLRQFVRAPESFRARNKMPAFAALTDPQLDELFAYFHFMKDRKQKVDPK